MPRSPASFTQAEVERAVRAAKAEGWHVVRVVLPSGAAIEVANDTIAPQASPVSTGERQPEPVANDDDVVIL